MTVEIPEIDEIITDKEMAEVEEFLKIIYPGDRVAPSVEVELPKGRFRVFEGVGSALATLAITYALAKLIGKITRLDTPRQRRRRKTQICVMACLDILKGAKEDIDQGYFRNRALETSDNERRTRRNFKSRA